MLPFTTTTQADCSKPDAACELESFLLVLLWWAAVLEDAGVISGWTSANSVWWAAVFEDAGVNSGWASVNSVWKYYFIGRHIKLFQLNFLAFEKNIKFCVQIQTTTSIFRDVQDWTPLQPGAVCIGTVLHVLQVHEKKVLIIKELIFEFPVDCLTVNSISINFFEH